MLRARRGEHSHGAVQSTRSFSAQKIKKARFGALEREVACRIKCGLFLGQQTDGQCT